MPELSLTLPCYNEERLVRRTVEDLAGAFADGGHDVELILVDNGSTDGTGAVIDQMIADGLPVIKRTVPVNKGYGLGVLVGLSSGTAPYVGVIPADGQVEAADVARLFHVLKSAEAPRLVKVRRRFRLDGVDRKVISTIYNVLVNILWGGLGSIDVNGSPKMFPRDYLERMELRSTDWFLDAEILIRAKKLDLPVFEMNVFAQMRAEGESNVDMGTVTEFLKNLAKWRIRPPAPADDLEAALAVGLPPTDHTGTEGP